MTEIELNNEYFEWMCQLVCNERYSRRLSYQKLLRHLHNIDFQYMLPMDGNRAEDGIDLRYRCQLSGQPPLQCIGDAYCLGVSLRGTHYDRPGYR